MALRTRQRDLIAEKLPKLPNVLFFQRTTSNNGCLGSRIDEDRSEFRYVMRIAGFVNHQTVERTLPFSVGGGFLFECGFLSIAQAVCGAFLPTRVPPRPERQGCCRARRNGLVTKNSARAPRQPAHPPHLKSEKATGWTEASY